MGELQINTKDKFLLDQNHQKLNKSRDPTKANLGLFFFGNFLEKFLGEIGGIGGCGGQIRGNQGALDTI